MPGRSLNHREKQLLNLWQNPPNDIAFPSLRSLEISSRPGVRGIHSLRVPFKYPITAICGANGVGKSTILALSALAFHSPAEWFVHLGNANPKRITGTRSYYQFRDFFKQGMKDTAIYDTSVTWRYYDGEEHSVEFKKKIDGGCTQEGRNDLRIICPCAGFSQLTRFPVW